MKNILIYLTLYFYLFGLTEHKTESVNECKMHAMNYLLSNFILFTMESETRGVCGTYISCITFMMLLSSI